MWGWILGGIVLVYTWLLRSESSVHSEQTQESVFKCERMLKILLRKHEITGTEQEYIDGLSSEMPWHIRG